MQTLQNGLVIDIFAIGSGSDKRNIHRIFNLISVVTVRWSIVDWPKGCNAQLRGQVDDVRDATKKLRWAVEILDFGLELSTHPAINWCIVGCDCLYAINQVEILEDGVERFRKVMATVGA